jgi:hypothetical protein
MTSPTHCLIAVALMSWLAAIVSKAAEPAHPDQGVKNSPRLLFSPEQMPQRFGPCTII